MPEPIFLNDTKNPTLGYELVESIEGLDIYQISLPQLAGNPALGRIHCIDDDSSWTATPEHPDALEVKGFANELYAATYLFECALFHNMVDA